MKLLTVLFLLFISFTSNSQVNLTNGLVAYYPFNGNANDASGNGNDGIAFNVGQASDHFGNPNKALAFDGTTSYIRVPNSASFAVGNNITIAVFVKVLGFYSGNCHGNNILIKGFDDAYPNESILRFDDGEYLNGQQCLSPTVDQAHQNFYGKGINPPAYTPFITTNKWYSVVYTYDGSTAKIYIDGVLKSATANSSLNFTNSYDIYIGRTNNPADYYYLNGVLDEMRIYNRAITTDEINALQNYTPLPVNISYFNADIVNNKNAQLVWKTEEESNVERYEIERSEDGNNFIKIGYVNSLNSSSNNYNYLDETIHSNITYQYRLKTIFKSQEYSFSEIKNVRIKTTEYKMLVFPNPVHGDVLITLDGYKGIAKVSLVSTIGQTVYNTNINFVSREAIKINLANIQKGMYLLKVNTINGDYTQKIEIH